MKRLPASLGFYLLDIRVGKYILDFFFAITEHWDDLK
jgi:hypothetical protein